MISPELATGLTSQFGLQFEAAVSQTSEGTVFEAWPAGVPRMDGFALRATVGWHSVQCSLEFGSFAGELMAATSAADDSQRGSFEAFARQAVDAGADVHMLLDGASADPVAPESWPPSWSRLELTLTRAPVETADGAPDRVRALALEWIGLLTGMVVSLLPLEASEVGRPPDVSGLPEGAVSKVFVNRYERNPVNRALCLAANGTACQACGFEFGRVYGPVGEGFIEVHHRMPVSTVAPGYRIDPVSDLIPLCPNCHAMAHRKEVPFTVEELRALLKDARSLGAEKSAEAIMDIEDD